jgi:hypothetical protein
VDAIDTRALGEAVVQLGGGRLKQDDRLDLAVGLSDIARIGQEVDSGTPLLRIHAASEEAARAVAGHLRAAFTVGRARGRAADPDPRKDRLMPRAFLVVMDSVGCGGAPDADRFFNGDLPDTGSNTLGHIAAACAKGEAEEGRSGSLAHSQP